MIRVTVSACFKNLSWKEEILMHTSQVNQTYVMFDMFMIGAMVSACFKNLSRKEEISVQTSQVN